MARSWGIDKEEFKGAKEVENNDTLQPGWVWAELEDVEDTEDGNAQILTFRLMAGPNKGKSIKDWIRDPDIGKDDNARKIMRRRLLYIALRLNLISDDDFKGSGNINFDYADAIGTAVFLHLVMKKVTRKDGSQYDAANIDMFGFYPRGHEALPKALLQDPELDWVSQADVEATKTKGAAAPTTSRSSAPKQKQLNTQWEV